MPKRFSVIDCGEQQVVKSGFIEPDSLSDILEVVEALSKVSTYEQVEISIFHVLFLDLPDAPIEDATEEEVEILNTEFSHFYEEGWLETEEVIEMKVRGISKETEYVEHGDF